ncbi:MAG TPA: PLP-dependent aspartate aminotransferase family protein [Pyrinomonadaceae bacterium]|nr:PLP-dependent aspartate aminotransferase family protein [Pyrinomonadaceae bacterium]
MKIQKTKQDITTKLVHAGERRPLPDGKPVATPIYASATFTYDSMQEIDQVFAGEKQGFIYTRYGNPTIAALEEAVREVEEGATACAYSTGMAAIHAALIACDLRSGSTVLASQDLYGATTSLLNGVLINFGVKTVIVDFADLPAVREKAREVRPQIMIAETISNPLLKLCDIKACVEIARENSARLIVDNTFASPYLCQPLKLGADIVVHSATKYLGGHADAMGGLVISRDEMDSAALVSVMKLVGGVLGVWEAHEILRGLKTLAVRMERQCENARRLANHLSESTRVARVHYPGLGALVSIELRDGSREAAFRFMDALELCVRSTSLGDVFTSVLHPATASHRDLLPARRQELGIVDGLVRISVGIESIDDIVADIEQALAAG